MTNDPVNTSQQKKNTTDIEPRINRTVIHIPLLNQHRGKFPKDGSCSRSHDSSGCKNYWGKTSSLHLPNPSIMCSTFLLFMNLVVPWQWGVSIGVRKRIKHLNVKKRTLPVLIPKVPSNNIKLSSIFSVGSSVSEWFMI